MKRDNKPIEPDASPRSAKTKKLRMPPKARNMCSNCAQPLPRDQANICAACLDNVEVIAEFPF